MFGFEETQRYRERRTRGVEVELHGVEHLAVDHDVVVALGVPVDLEVVSSKLEFSRDVAQSELDSIGRLDQRHGSGRADVDRRLLEPFRVRRRRGNLDGGRDALRQIVHDVLAGAAVGGSGGLSGLGAHGERNAGKGF